MVLPLPDAAEAAAATRGACELRSLPENKIVELSAQLDHKNRNVD
jgi:hypothetical protein